MGKVLLIGLVILFSLVAVVLVRLGKKGFSACCVALAVCGILFGGYVEKDTRSSMVARVLDAQEVEQLALTNSIKKELYNGYRNGECQIVEYISTANSWYCSYVEYKAK